MTENEKQIIQLKFLGSWKEEECNWTTENAVGHLN